MTDIEAKALALVNEVRSEYPFAADYHAIGIALNRAIEQHEAFKQEVSDAVLSAMKVLLEMAEHDCEVRIRPILERFIIPKPKRKPDPLIEVLRSVGGDDRDYCDYDIYVKEIRAALEARGLEIREKGQ